MIKAANNGCDFFPSCKCVFVVHSILKRISWITGACTWISRNMKYNVTENISIFSSNATQLNQRNEKWDIVRRVSHATGEFFIKLVPFYVLYTRINPYQDALDNRSLLIKVKCCLKASFRMTTLYCGPSATEITFIHRFRKIILESFLFQFLFFWLCWVPFRVERMDG